LIVGASQVAALAALRLLAAKSPVAMPPLMERLKTPEGKRAHMAQMDVQTVEIPLGFLVTFSIETGHGAGTCRHMSMSSPKRGRLPAPEALWMVAEHLGFVGGLEACTHWIEDLQRGSGDRQQVVNLVQPIDVVNAGADRPN
jgi:hypothetical protein